MGKVAVHYGWIPMILYIGMVVFWGEADFRIYAEFASASVLEVVRCLGVELIVDCLHRLAEFDGVSCGGVIRVGRGRMDGLW